ncbi:hypothetical protein UlMin_022411 [Ulmus minor]
MKARLLVAVVLLTWVLSIGGEADQESDRSPCKFPAIYNFGDSNSDTGGNSAAFYQAGPPSGETFFHRPAGRGSDGRLIIDFIAKHLGLPYLSPFLDSIGTSFRHGANFAYGGATIRRYNESFFQNGVSPFSLDIQTVQFYQYKDRTRWFYKHANKRLSLKRNLPRPEDFSKALYILDIGQNDVAAGIRSPNKAKFYADIPDIMDKFALAVEDLYERGARAFWIHNTGPIGCLPVAMRSSHDSTRHYFDRQGCVNFQNDMAKEFNRQLKQKVTKLRPKLPLAAITYVDMYAAKYSLISNAKKQGFLDNVNICCGFHEGDIHVYCGNKLKINGTEIYAGSCKDPSKYISWDGVHYTEAANHWIASQIATGFFSDPPVPITHACYKHQSL